MDSLRVRMFAGPNGSGKTDFIDKLQASNLPLGSVINADKLLFEFQNAGFIDLSVYNLTNLKQESWDTDVKEISELTSRIDNTGIQPEISINEGVLISEADKTDAYTAALIADFLRYRMVDQQINFSFETVMSHASKIDFLKFAKEKKYKTYLYFIATEDPSINIERVKNRVKKGGHDVPLNKIKARYYRSLDLLMNALNIVDGAYIMDNSEKKSAVIFEKKNDGKGYRQVKNYPRWFEKAVIEKLK